MAAIDFDSDSSSEEEEELPVPSKPRKGNCTFPVVWLFHIPALQGMPRKR